MPTVLLVTDIFGDSAQLRATLARLDISAVVVSPYPEIRAFANETEAYQAFLTAGGLDAYYQRLLRVVPDQTNSDLKLMLGFSAGAAALWRFISNEQAQQFAGTVEAWLYYGGQIRHELNLEPKLTTSLRWSLETQFDVWQCHQAMQHKATVDSIVLPYPHGFINPQSKGFITNAAADFWSALASFLHASSPMPRK